MTAPPAGALEACKQRALDGLLSNLEHEAGDVEDAAPSIEEDEDAYWAYQSYHAIRSLQRALLAALRLRDVVEARAKEWTSLSAFPHGASESEITRAMTYFDAANDIRDDLARVLEEGE